MHNVANYAIIANNRWVLRRGMNNGVVLNTGARTNLDVSIVATQYCAWPNG
jgi:hypothetical protein